MSWVGGSKLQKQKSNCSAFAMEVGNWCTSRCSSVRYVNGSSDEYPEEIAAFTNLPEYRNRSSSNNNNNNMTRWRLFWRRIKKEKKKIFDSSSSNPFQVPYDPYTYSQNFDQGTAWTEPDNLPRSFSARFADPSRIFQRNAVVIR